MLRLHGALSVGQRIILSVAPLSLAKLFAFDIIVVDYVQIKLCWFGSKTYPASATKAFISEYKELGRYEGPTFLYLRVGGSHSLCLAPRQMVLDPESDIDPVRSLLGATDRKIHGTSP